MFTPGEIIDLAIRIERNGEKVYRKAMGQVSDPSVASLLRKLSEDEAEHVIRFSEMKERLPERTEVDRTLQEMAGSILGGILGEQSFSLEEADFSNIAQLNELIDISIDFEKDTILFYELIGSMAPGLRTPDHLEAILREENRHIRELEELRASRK